MPNEQPRGRQFLQRLDEVADLVAGLDVAEAQRCVGHFLVKQHDAAEVAFADVARDGFVAVDFAAAKNR